MSDTAVTAPPVASPPATTPALAAKGGLVSNLAAGTLSALVTLSYSASYAALIFSGPDLQAHLAYGLYAALMAAWLVALVVALKSPFFFSIAGPDSNATAILAVMAATVAAALTAQNASPAQVAATVLALLTISAVLVGVMVYAIGALQRGKLIRFLPYPVVGGFLAGTGYLVTAGAYKVLTGKALAFETLLQLHVPAFPWVVACCVALALLIIPRFYKHFLVMPCVIVAGVIVFYAGTRLAGLDGGPALLTTPASAEVSSVGLSHCAWASLDLVRWNVLLEQWPNLLAMTVVVIITILLNATGLDLATQHDADFDRELRVNGAANMLSGLAGGMIGYLSVSRSLLNFKAGAVSRAAGVWTAILCAGAAFLFSPAIAYFPRPVLAGLLLYLGLSMLREWVWDAFSKLPVHEYALIVGILLLIALQGLITGVAFGLLVASIFFVYSYSRTNCIKHSFASSTHFSNKERALDQIAILKQKGQVARALCLQGYIFFGTSSVIVETCRELIEREQAKFLLLDFRMVQGLDASAVLSFTKLEQLCARHGVKLSLSGLRPELEAVLKQAHFLPKREIRLFADMDRGLEWIEDWLLSGLDGGLGEEEPADAAQPEHAAAPGLQSVFLAEQDLRRILSAHFDPASLDTLISHCQTLKLPQGQYLFRQGDPGDALYFVERGELSVMLPLADGQSKRLRTFGPGTVVGEMALYSRQPRSADVITDMPCRVRKLSAEDFAHLEDEHAGVAIQFHSFVVRLLAARLAAANDEIRVLL